MIRASFPRIDGDPGELGDRPGPAFEPIGQVAARLVAQAADHRADTPATMNKKTN